MEQTQIEKGNALILEFEGFVFTNDDPAAYPNGYYYNPDEGYHTLGECKFNTSWDWIMPVVEKIELLGYDTRIGGVTLIKDGVQSKLNYAETESIIGDTISYCNGTTKIESVWLAVVEFIKWKNSK